MLACVSLILPACSFVGEKAYEKASSGPNFRIEPTGLNKGIAKYDWGAFVEPNSKGLAEKAMEEYCTPRKLKIISTDDEVIGEKKFLVTMTFECVN